MKNSSNSIENLQREYAKSVELANQNIKFAEQSVAFEDDSEEIQISGLSLPAINELRCSASHISLAFSTVDIEEQKLAYQQAIHHCKRASYEAMDALLQYYLKECRRFQNDYRTVQIDNVPKGYQEDCLYLNEIKSKLPSRSEYEMPNIK